MHTATLKSGEGCASKAALGEPGSVSLAGTLEEGQEEQGGGGPGLQEKHLGLRKHSPDKPKFRSMENWKPSSPGQPFSGPSCPDLGTHIETWLMHGAWTFCCHACTSPWPKAIPGKEMPRLPVACCLLPGMGGGEVRGRGIFWFLPYW